MSICVAIPEKEDGVTGEDRCMTTTEDLVKIDAVNKLDEARQLIRSDLYKDRFSIHAMFSGGRPCLCGKPIQVGEEITRPPQCPVWMHTTCVDVDASTPKPVSKAFQLIQQLARQATVKQGVWRDDLLQLAKMAFLGTWGTDYWLEDRSLAVYILDVFGFHRLTAGWRCSSEKAKQKYAQKIEKEFAKHKGWVCRICHRLIWVEKSVDRAMGPVCYKHIYPAQ